MIPITKPVFDAEEAAAVAEVLRSGWVSQGPKVAEFERAFAPFVGTAQAVATTSCTAAEHLALEDLGIATRQGTHAVPPLGLYRDTCRPEDFPRALEADRTTLTLPLYPQMTDEEQDRVVCTLRQALQEEM